MFEEDGTTEGTHREKALRETRKIGWWLGERKSGDWVSDAILTSVVRDVHRHTKSKTEKNEDGSPKIVVAEEREVVHAHGGYRPRFDGEKKTRKAFFFRGARVWRD